MPGNSGGNGRSGSNRPKGVVGNTGPVGNVGNCCRNTDAAPSKQDNLNHLKNLSDKLN